MRISRTIIRDHHSYTVLMTWLICVWSKIYFIVPLKINFVLSDVKVRFVAVVFLIFHFVFFLQIFILLCLWFAMDMKISVVSKRRRGKLQQYFLELMNATFDDSASYNIIPTLKHETPLVRHSVKGKRKVYGTSSCKIARQLLKCLKRPKQNKKSTCPWYVYLGYDSERLHKITAKAGCTCRNCIGEMDSSASSPGQYEVVESFRLVIRRRCKTNNKCVYSVEVESVPDGCSCNRIVHNITNRTIAPAVSDEIKIVSPPWN